MVQFIIESELLYPGRSHTQNLFKISIENRNIVTVKRPVRVLLRIGDIIVCSLECLT